MNQHRKVIYMYRRNVLDGEQQLHELVNDMIITSVQDAFARFMPTRAIIQEEKKHFWVPVKNY